MHVMQQVHMKWKPLLAMGAQVWYTNPIPSLDWKNQAWSPFDHDTIHHHLQMSSVQNSGWLFDIGDYTTQSYGDYNAPL